MIKSGDGQCTKYGEKWEIRTAMRPFTYDGPVGVSGWGMGWLPGDWFIRGASGKTVNVQKRTKLQKNSAGLNKWDKATFAILDMHKGNNDLITPMDVFEYSEKCQSQKGDPFQPYEPSVQDLYKSMEIKSADILSSNVEPLCLFNIPIFERSNSNLNEWCRQNVGTARGSSFTSDGVLCGDVTDWWVVQASTKMCGQVTSTTVQSRKGCENFDRGIYPFKRSY